MEPAAATTTSPQLTAAAVLEALERACRVEPWLRAFITDLAPLHVESADGTDAGGAFSGMPIAVKGTRGVTSPRTRRLQRAGAVPIGGTSAWADVALDPLPIAHTDATARAST